MLSSILILWDSLLNLISELPKAVVARSEGMVHATAATVAHFLVAVYVMMPPPSPPPSVHLRPHPSPCCDRVVQGRPRPVVGWGPSWGCQ